MTSPEEPTSLAIFDYHGTLIWALDAHDAAFRDTVHELFGVEGGSIHDTAFAASTIQDVTRGIAQAKGVPDEAIAAKAAEILSTHERHFAHHIATTEVTVLPGVPEVLEGLSRSRFGLALYTGDSAPNIQAVLARTNIGPYFHPNLRTCASRSPPVTERKALLEEAVRTARQKYGVDFPQNRIFVFDDSTSGIRAGSDLDLVTVAVATGPQDYERLNRTKRDYIFRDLSDHARVLETVFRHNV